MSVEEGSGVLPTYEPPSIKKAEEFYLTTLPHRIHDAGQVGDNFLSEFM